MDKKSLREIAIASAMYSLGSILGPLLVIGGIGLLLDKVFNTYPLILLLSVLVAFVVTNILLFKKIKKINRLMDKFREEALAEKEKEKRIAVKNLADQQSVNSLYNQIEKEKINQSDAGLSVGVSTDISDESNK